MNKGKGKNEKVQYSEPVDYIPKEIRKKYKLGEFAEKDETKNQNDERAEANKAFRLYVKGN